MDKAFTFLLLICLLNCFSPWARAAKPADVKTASSPQNLNAASWVQPPPLKLQIHLGKGLTQKQLVTLNSGFSTFSRLQITAPGIFKDQVLASTACTVKYDMWEERYQVILLSEPPVTKTVKDFDEYTLICLSAEIIEATTIEKLKTQRGYLIATLQIEQISSSQAHKIKSWLIKQQSAVMRGLFSHMIGELTLTQTSEIKLQVPPL